MNYLLSAERSLDWSPAQAGAGCLTMASAPSMATVAAAKMRGLISALISARAIAYRNSKGTSPGPESLWSWSAGVSQISST